MYKPLINSFLKIKPKLNPLIHLFNPCHKIYTLPTNNLLKTFHFTKIQIYRNVTSQIISFFQIESYFATLLIPWNLFTFFSGTRNFKNKIIEFV